MFNFKHFGLYGNDAWERRLMECGNTEAEGFLCRFHFATEILGDEKRFFTWGTPSALLRQTPLRGGIAAR
ncbi:MAG: hypothetical protein Q4A17_10160 [Thermoguttaceae bacterium]|nr:hypothetical protein [Thermoguttaceae bacterium]